MPTRDEPAKLRDLVVPLFEGDKGHTVALDNGAVASLLLGASDQDDCAAYHVSGETIIVAGSDYIRGVDFFLFEAGHLSHQDVGWYLAGANFSDIAAMGAKPLALLSVVRYPKDLDDSIFSAMLRGVADSCRAVGAINAGGDIGTADKVVLSGAALGIVEPQQLLSRGGAAVGDYVCLTGTTGEAGAAMKLARAGRLTSFAGADDLLHRWRRVRPRVVQGRIFASSGEATACVDTSDGLKAALMTIASASGVGISIEAERVPESPNVVRAAEALDVDVADLVYGDSVDFELVATLSEVGLDRVRERFETAGLPLHVIGRVTEGNGTVRFAGSSSVGLPGQEWRHSQ